MRLPVIAALGLSLCGFQIALAADNSATLSNETDRISYTLGADMGSNFRNNKIDINADVLYQGLKDGMAGGDLKLTKEQMEQTLTNFQNQLQQSRQAAFTALSEKNLKEGEAFLAKNKTADGVTALPNGLQYRVIKAGTGDMPKAGDMVTVNYEGRFVDGTVFDSSFKRGRPATFPVSGVIPGWQEALKMMKKGGSWEVFIPASLGYGKQGIGGVIGPNETLIFKVDLLDVKAKKAQQS